MNRKNRVLNLLLAIVLILSLIPVQMIFATGQASDAAQSVYYNAAEAVDNPLDAVEYGSSTAATSSDMYRKAWRLSSQMIDSKDPDGEPGKYLEMLLFRLSPEFKSYVAQANNQVTISVTYWDGFSAGTDSGHFSISYDCVDEGDLKTRQTGACILEGTNSWKTYDFKLTDAVLDADVNRKGFQLNSQAANLGATSSDVLIGRVAVSCKVDGQLKTAYVNLDTNLYNNKNGIDEVLYNTGSGYNAIGCVDVNTPSWMLHPGSEAQKGWFVSACRDKSLSSYDAKREAIFVKNLNADFLAKAAEAGKVTLSVTYWDGKAEKADGDGKIGIRYFDDVENKVLTYHIVMTGANEWRTATFTLNSTLKDIDGDANRKLTIHGWDSYNHVYINKLVITCETAEETYTAFKSFDTDALYDGTNIGHVLHNTGSGTKPIIESLGALPKDKDALWFSVDEQFRQELTQKKNGDVIVTVDYLDSGVGFFALTYDNGDADRKSGFEKIQLKNTGLWKTHSVLLTDAVLENWGNAAADSEAYGRGFGLCTYLADGTRSTGSVFISGVTLKFVEQVEPESYGISITAEETCYHAERISVVLMPTCEELGGVWSSVDISLKYDPKILKLETTSLGQTFKLTDNQGELRIVGFGVNKFCNTEGITLEFSAVGFDKTAIEIISAVIGSSDSAPWYDALAAQLTTAKAEVEVGYAVTLGKGLKGDALASPSKDYRFTVDNPYYYYSFTLNDEKFTPKAFGDGVYAVPKDKITDTLDIKITGKSPRSFTASLETGENVKAECQETVTYGSALMIPVTREEGIFYTCAMTVNGIDYNGFVPTSYGYLVPGVDITGDFVITVSQIKDEEEEIKEDVYHEPPPEENQPTDQNPSVEPTTPVDDTTDTPDNALNLGIWIFVVVFICVCVCIVAGMYLYMKKKTGQHAGEN